MKFYEPSDQGYEKTIKEKLNPRITRMSRMIWKNKTNGNRCGKLIYGNETYSIIGCAFEVYNQLGTGFLEPVYQEALEIEMKIKNIPFCSQVKLPIKYKEQS